MIFIANTLISQAFSYGTFLRTENERFFRAAKPEAQNSVDNLKLIIRAKRVSNWYIPQKKSARVPVWTASARSTTLGFSVGSANRLRPKHGIPLPV